MSAETAAQRALDSNPGPWYHTIDLAPGISTPGHVDLRELASRLLPDDLRGMRALDIGTFDGFWAFEMERRGAEVVAIDVGRLESAEWPPANRARLEARAGELDLRLGRGFAAAAEALGSRVVRVICPVYELTPEAIGGDVDFAFSGSILVHLRDPVRALERIHSALRPGGELRLMEPVSLLLSAVRPRTPVARFMAASTDFNWWQPNLATLKSWPRTAGFDDVRRIAFARPPSRPEMRQRYACVSARTGR